MLEETDFPILQEVRNQTDVEAWYESLTPEKQKVVEKEIVEIVQAIKSWYDNFCDDIAEYIASYCKNLAVMFDIYPHGRRIRYRSSRVIKPPKAGRGLSRRLV